MTDRVRRRDGAIAGESRRTRTPLIVSIALLVLLVLFLWVALQTLGGSSTKHAAVASAQLL
jgi:hypothetical protein